MVGLIYFWNLSPQTQNFLPVIDNTGYQIWNIGRHCCHNVTQCCHVDNQGFCSFHGDCLFMMQSTDCLLSEATNCLLSEVAFVVVNSHLKSKEFGSAHSRLFYNALNTSGNKTYQED